jgi:hypothetical protein
MGLKRTNLLLASPLSLLPLVLLHCGGRAQGTGDGGDSHDALSDTVRAEVGNDRAMTDEPDAATDRDADSASDVGFAEEVGPDAFPQPRDAQMESCVPFVCKTDQVCVSLLQSSGAQNTACVATPLGCEHGSECECLVQAAPWCKGAKCVIDGGDTVLTCEEPPP